MKIDLNKYLAKFGRTHHFVTRVLETNIPIGVKPFLDYKEGIYTIKKSKSEEQEKNPRKGGYYELSDKNIVKGYLDAKGKTPIHLLNNNKKLLKVVNASYYHALADDLAEVVFAMTLYPDYELVLDISNIVDGLNEPSMNFFGYFLDRLVEEGVTYTLVDSSKYDLMYINNFSVAEFPFHSGARLDLLSNFMVKPEDRVEKPFRKVFVSRKLQGMKPDMEEAANFSYKNDTRIDNHEELEQIFIELGFEIVDAELLPDFKDQLQIFKEAKVLVSLTSSGITNSIFMNPGSTLVEIVTPLITQTPLANSVYFDSVGIDPTDYELDINVVQEVHMFYHNLAFFKNFLYVGIPNYTRENKKIREFIDAHPSLKALLSE